MKAKHLLIISLSLNLLLVLYIVRPSPARESVDSPNDEVVRGDSPADVVQQALTGDSPDTPTPPRTFNWEQVESADYREYIENLRAIGCPEETIRDIIVADVNKLYSAKKRELRGEPKKFEYWKAGNPWMAQMDTEFLASTRALEEEKLNVLRQLGIEPDAKMQMASLNDPTDAMNTMFGFLSEEKQLSVVKIMQDMQGDLVDAAGDGGFDQEAMRDAQKKMEDAIKAVLSPEEFRDYELRMSATATTMRSQLAGWEPEEQEFLKVYELRKTFDDEFSMFDLGNQTEDEQQQRQEAESQLNDAIQQVLGEDRYEDYERSKDYTFQQMYQAAKRADLGTTEAIQMYDMKAAAETEVRNVRGDQDLTSEQRTAALEGIQAETERSFQEVLGEEGWEKYNRGYNTHWLNNMVPPTSSEHGHE